MAGKMQTSSWTMRLLMLLSVLQYVLAYRPVQHCKVLGEGGHYSACAAITQHFNTTTGESDMYLRYRWFKYRKSKNGWHAVAIGQRMDGAFMLVMYGDPTALSVPMTVDVRSANGWHPPTHISEFEEYATADVPIVEVVTAAFTEYHGDIKIEKLNETPTHVGTAEVIIRGYEKWTGFPTQNTSTSLSMLWASNYKQKFDGDYSPGRKIYKHPFGLGFGFLYVDILNAATPYPMFGPIDEHTWIKGASEYHVPNPPTSEELQVGANYIAENGPAGGDAALDTTVPAPPPSSPPPSTPPPPTQPSSQNEATGQPPRTILGQTLRNWMWHLHGLMMSLAFLALYPLGTYLIRSGNPKAFNLHWTVQSLATVSLVIGSIIGYFNSHSISIKHQYIGIAIFVATAVQIVLGWRHHVQFVATKTKGWLSRTHIILGRIILPLGYVNLILGMLLQGYGWFTMILAFIAIGLETVFLGYVLVQASRKSNTSTDKRSGPPQGDEAEEYFQLAADDDFSDSEDGEHEGNRVEKDRERQRQAERLRKLDRV